MTLKAALHPLNTLKVSKHQISSHGFLPNTSLQGHALIHYHGAFLHADTSFIESHIQSVGVFAPSWRYSMYNTTHFHSTSHELLCVASGSAKCCFGGEENPNRYEPTFSKGDVILVPAGVAHRLLEEKERPFKMVGCYPPGMHWDMCYGTKDEEAKIQALKAVPWFDRDPLYGDEGPLIAR